METQVNVLDRLEKPCPTCGGSGKLRTFNKKVPWHCADCGGFGHVPESDLAYAERMKGIALELAKVKPHCDDCGEARKICCFMKTCAEARLTAAAKAMKGGER